MSISFKLKKTHKTSDFTSLWKIDLLEEQVEEDWVVFHTVADSKAEFPSCTLANLGKGGDPTLYKRIWLSSFSFRGQIPC